jgi:hypothetical protein
MGEISHVFYCAMERKWGKNEYGNSGTSRERNGIGWLKTGALKL